MEKAFNEKHILTALAFDIKGAFDRVTEKRLIQRLYEQNIPLPLLCWVASFLSDRSAAIRLDGHTGDQEPIQIGVPQGSPALPILFMLFTAPLYKILQGNNKKAGLTIRGYVEDGLLTARATNETKSVILIQEAFEKVEQWAHQNGMIFDPDKFEAIHFSRKKSFPNPDILLPVHPLSSTLKARQIVKPVLKTAAMRWLGVFFDARLSFKYHVTNLASKARVAAARLGMLANSVRGVKPLVMRKAVHACIIPILTYGAPAWWPDVTRTNQKGKIVQNRIQGLCEKLDKAQNIALKAILPAWKTTTTKILQREAATPPIRHTMNHLCELASLRLHKLEPKHPLRMRTKRAFAALNPTRLERLARRCPENVEFSNPLVESEPWEEHILGGANKALTASGATGDKDKAAKKFNAWLQNLDPLDIVV